MSLPKIKMRPNPALTVPSYGETRSDVWIQWYEELRNYFGNKMANSLFVQAWSLRGTSDANTHALRTALQKGGLSIDQSAWDNIVDAGAGVWNFAGDILNVGKYTGLALIGILVGGIGMIIFNVANRPAETAGTIIKYAK